MEKKVTISDIARAVGVSKTTVSRYLNGNYGYMSDATRARIAEVIAQYGYVPSSVARTLKSKRSHLVGVIVNSLRYQIGAQTVTQINEVCMSRGYGTVVWCTDDDPDRESEAIQSCLNQQVDGIIIIPCTEDVGRYAAICAGGVPTVLCTRPIPRWPYGSVNVRHDALIRTLLSHLSEQGFEKARFLVDVDNFHKVSMATAFSDGAARLFGMSPEESVVYVGMDEGGVNAALKCFLGEYPGQKKAVVAVNTHTLFLTLRYLEQHGISVPDGAGVCGYDALGWSELVSPGITSIHQPMDEMGRVAGEKLLACLRDGSLGSGRTELDGTVTFRASTLLRK